MWSTKTIKLDYRCATSLIGLLFVLSSIEASALEAGALQRNIEQQLPPVDALPSVGPDKKPELIQRKSDPNAVKVLVTSFEFQGVTLFTDAQLQEVVKPWINKSVTLPELQEAADAVANYYRTQGKVAQVQIPPQKLSNGHVILKVLEAKLGSVKMRTDPDARVEPEFAKGFVTVNNPPGEFIDTNSVERSIFLIKELPGVSVTTELSPGDKDGEANLLVNLEDTPLVNGKVDFNNYGSRSTGQNQGVAMLAINDLTGYGDQVLLSGITSQGSNYVLAGYSFPVSQNGLRFGLSGSQLNYHNVGSFEANGSYGAATVGSAYLSYALHRSEGANANLLLSYDQKTYMNRSIATSAISSNYIIRDINLGISGNRYDDWFGGGINSGSLTLTSGTLNFFADQYDAGPNTYGLYTPRNFQKMTFMASRNQQIIPNETILNVTLTGQLANQNLDPAEKFYLGGANGVQAYPVGQAAGSQGFLAVAEIQQQLPYNIIGSISVQYGMVQQYVNPYPGWQGQTGAPNWYGLGGIGPGLKWTYERLTLSGSVAWALGPNPLKSATGQTVNVDGWSPAYNNLQPAYGWFQASLTF
jgi:hemolysin activation/secretion protein